MKTIKYVLAILISIAVSACGGSSSSAPTPPPATYTISGTVTQAVGGAPVSGVTVTLSGASTATATTALDGTYSFAGLANGNYTVTSSKSGSAFSPVSRAVSVSGANTTGQGFTATAATTTYSISGTVTGASGVTITLGGANTGSVVTGAGGTYTFTGLAVGNYTLTPSLTGYTFTPASRTITGLAANSTGNNFGAAAIPVSHSISGNVSGATSVTITVTGTASAAPVTTDASGNYTVSGLYDGTYTVTPSKTGYTFTPLSSSVTMAGANVTATNFAGTANASVTATVSGTLTGAWVEGVTITMTGGATTTTNASGNYSFANVPSGATYTFTPSLDGYTYSPASQSVTIAGGSNAAVTVPVMAAASTIANYSISGTVSYAGSKTGPVALWVYPSNCIGCIPAGGATIAAPGAYTIRGLVDGSYVVVAGMDALGTGKRNATNPNGQSTATTIAGANGTANVTLTDPALPAPATPTGLRVQPGANGAAVFWNGAFANGVELSDHYKIYWGTDANAANGTPITVTADTDQMYAQSASNGSVYYYKVSALVNGAESAPSAVFGPVTIGAVAGLNTVSGVVTFPGTATGPLTVGVYDDSTNTVRFARIANPVSPQYYSITGVASGTYNNFANIDMNNNGLFDTGDVSNTNNQAPSITVNGNVTGDITLTSGPATALARTRFYSYTGGSNYNLDLSVKYGAKRIKTVTLISGLNMPLPLDLGRDWDGFRVWSNGMFTPVVGQSYKFRVTYADNTSQDLSDSVTAVFTSNNLAQSPQVSYTAPGSATVPQFSWTAPATAPAAPYSYQMSVSGTGANWWSNNMPSSQFSVLYNADSQSGTPTLQSLSTYNWQISVVDAKGNVATLQAPAFTTP